MNYQNRTSHGMLLDAVGNHPNRIIRNRASRIDQITSGWIRAVLLVLVSGLIGVAQAAPKNQPAGHAAPTPEGFTKFLVYMAEPTLAPGEPVQFTDPASVDLFQRVIMGRTPEEIEQDRAGAVQFFWDRFDLDFSQAQPDANDHQSIPGATL
jgi:hypothetical protein